MNQGRKSFVKTAMFHLKTPDLPKAIVKCLEVGQKKLNLALTV
jgi:hypothetical protein